jgi:hypothetical protein
VVVAKRKVGEVAMQVKNDISININEVVTLALLGINESVNLKYILIFHLSINYLISLVQIVRLSLI